MAKLTFVIGLCGSGKSYLSEKLAESTGVRLFEGLVEKQQVDLPELLHALKNGLDCVVEEISFCIPENRESIVQIVQREVPDAEIEWICFKNDLDAANWNVMHRTNKTEPDRHKEINERVHRGYIYPEGCKPIPITRVPKNSTSPNSE
jgi:cytidylate kinase